MNRILAMLLLCCVVTSCYHVRTVADPEAQRDANPRTATVCIYLWGLVQPRIVAPECESKALQEVRTSTNLGFALITVATLGILCPLTVEYTCAKPCDVHPTPQ
ncbi:MAG: hypothetical protein FGM24_08910 [Candidatus Kapabacteria bacterium]|nr:hypothetical protein [Candidatus Kapabacteria bacterium]